MYISLLFPHTYTQGSDCGKMDIVLENEHDEQSSNPGQSYLHFT